MKISAEERLMYNVMKAIYESGIPISFKGSMVLKVCLMEAGFTNDIRHTVDIDANWYSDDWPSGEQIEESIRKALRNSGIDLNVKLYRMYGEGRSAGFELSEPSSSEILFTMDIDVNRPAVETIIYEVAEIRFRGSALLPMLADKLSVISCDKVFRRVKDLIDLYYAAQVYTPDWQKVFQALKDSGKTLGSFDSFLNKPDDLRHAYSKFRFDGDVFKPAFEDVYQTVRKFIAEVLPEKGD
ncbi:MAG: nucleotidyl transferase AbiEii/AbiGii toxin family protein [Clostridiales bacterium]|nr:nucleotidyl transferase AbiEii/AbiGii toxin family protein [Clostridiales bacterium]